MSSSRCFDRTAKQKASRGNDKMRGQSPKRETLTYKLTLVTGAQANAGTSANVRSIPFVTHVLRKLRSTFIFLFCFSYMSD